MKRNSSNFKLTLSSTVGKKTDEDRRRKMKREKNILDIHEMISHHLKSTLTPRPPPWWTH
jgi:hypothetical protein